MFCSIGPITSDGIQRDATTVGSTSQLSEGTASLERAAAATKTQSREKLTELFTRVRDRAKGDVDELRGDGEQVLKDIRTHRDNLMDRLRTEVENTKDGLDADRAQRRADRAEVSAYWAVVDALYAVYTAEGAVLSSVLARADAEDAGVKSDRIN